MVEIALQALPVVHTDDGDARWVGPDRREAAHSRQWSAERLSPGLALLARLAGLYGLVVGLARMHRHLDGKILVAGDRLVVGWTQGSPG